MFRTSILLATLGLALNMLVWSVPGLVLASGIAQFALAGDGPTLVQRLTANHSPTARPTVPAALVGLLGAELEAIQVAGVAIERPSTPRLAEKADQAGGRVLEAVRVYSAAFQATFSP
jgi:hypothetical protein